MYIYKAIAREWDRLNRLTREEAELFDQTIEEGAAVALEQFTYQLYDKLTAQSPDVENLEEDIKLKVKRALSNSLFSGYLIMVAFQNLIGEKRISKIGIEYNPTLMDEYNDTVAPLQETQKNKIFNEFLDNEPSLELLMEKVANIELNILRKEYEGLENLSFKIGEIIRLTISKGVFIGFSIAYVENNIKNAHKVVN